MSASSSPASSPRASSHTSPVTLTPTRKVQALLAGLSDSESEGDTNNQGERRTNQRSLLDNDDSSEEEVVARSRLASRLAGKSITQSSTLSANENKRDTSLQRPLLRQSQPENQSEGSSAEEEANDSTHGQRSILRNAGSVSPRSDVSSPSARSASATTRPLSSPARERSLSVVVRDEPRSSRAPSPRDGKSKFLALVEKHRRERLAKEAEEIAKRAARGPSDPLENGPRRGARGSSPADDSEEESDDAEPAAITKLTQTARPTRKASKRAMEEMNRETQRMSRNMQLTHQARTKKKITKESLLARFNFASSDNENAAKKTNDKSSIASSATASDNESMQEHETPPTSPMHLSQDKMLPTTTEAPDEASSTNVAEPGEEDLDAMLEDMLAQRRAQDSEGKAREKVSNALTEDKQAKITQGMDSASGQDVPSERRPVQNIRMMVSATTADESDSDLEVITDKGATRKYAAFESLTRRKAKETPSHLALRSLAHLLGNEDKKRSMNAVEMELALRKAARKQAQEERKAKIEQLKAKGIFVQTAEEREREQQEVEDLVERARQEAAKIQKREREIAKRNGTLEHDALDDEDESDEDEEFLDEDDGGDEDATSASEDEDDEADKNSDTGKLVDDAAEETSEDDQEVEEEIETLQPAGQDDEVELNAIQTPAPSRKVRNLHVISDDEDDEEETNIRSPAVYSSKTPQSITRSARKVIPGLQMSDDLPLGLTQAFAATMADTQSQDVDHAEGQDSLELMKELPSPQVGFMASLNRLDSMDMISDSQPASETQPLDVNLSFSQTQQVPQSPAAFSHVTASEGQFDLTQDAGYMFSPFSGNRFAETPSKDSHSLVTDNAGIPPVNQSPVMQRKGRLRQGRRMNEDENEIEWIEEPEQETAFQRMRRAAKEKELQEAFDKKKSHARGIVDEAAEESDDEYAGLGGASDEGSDEEENEEDRKMIDRDNTIGTGDEAKLAQLYANRERESDEAAVSKLLKDITTGALRRKRGAGDDLDLSDEEDAVSRRREAKRREFAKMRRELLKDEAVGKIAEDKKKEAFLKSIEDHDEADDEGENEFDKPETPLEDDSQETSGHLSKSGGNVKQSQSNKEVLKSTSESQLNRMPFSSRRTTGQVSRKPTTLVEIRESVSFLIEEPDSQAGTIDLGLSDSEDEPEAYVNLDRHLKEAEADENALDDEDGEDLGDFIIDDDGNAKDSQDDLFKKPELPVKERAPFAERRTKNTNVVDRLSLMRQASSSSGSSISTKMAFFTSKTREGSFSKAPNLLRRATTNSSLGSMSGRESVSATGVVTNKTERGHVREEKEFVRKGSTTRRNAVNYQARQSLREEKMSVRAGINKSKTKKLGGGFLQGLFRSDSWQ